jgi:hypothetical protein
LGKELVYFGQSFNFISMSNTKRVNVVLSGKERRYFEDLKKQKGIQKDSECLRAMLKEHEFINKMKY